jgi:16S rRNA (guanine527-N7)-methyltransferase
MELNRSENFYPNPPLQLLVASCSSPITNYQLPITNYQLPITPSSFIFPWIMQTNQSTSQLPEMGEIWQDTLGWQPNPEQQQQFQRLYEAIVSGNRTLNLTRITEPMAFWEKHLWDSLRAFKPIWERQIGVERAIDIGTGAGIPGLPAAIVQPHWHITLLDSTRKKTAFLETVISTLAIENATTLTGRAEVLGRHPQSRNTYDLALLRAVGSPSLCAEYALPFLKPDGLAILYRGLLADEEMETLKETADRFGGTVEFVEAFTTPLTQAVRHCVYVRKLAIDRI